MNARGHRSTSLALAAVFMSAILSATEAPAPAVGCKTSPQVLEACRWVKGRVMATNGTPSMRLFDAGSRRVLGIVPSEAENVPPELAKKFHTVAFHGQILGDFQFCPYTSAVPGHMQMGCIEAARGLTVQMFSSK